eukprot:6850210-Alexandrium_andersonii.AAC.1
MRGGTPEVCPEEPGGRSGGGSPGHGLVPGVCSGWLVGGWWLAHPPPCWGHSGLSPSCCPAMARDPAGRHPRL